MLSHRDTSFFVKTVCDNCGTIRIAAGAGRQPYRCGVGGRLPYHTQPYGAGRAVGVGWRSP